MPLTVDHMCLIVPASKLDKMADFLISALKPWGFKEMMRPVPNYVGLGDQLPFFWIAGIEGDTETLEKVMKSQHTAFRAESKLRQTCTELSVS